MNNIIKLSHFVAQNVDVFCLRSQILFSFPTSELAAIYASLALGLQLQVLQDFAIVAIKIPRTCRACGEMFYDADVHDTYDSCEKCFYDFLD